MAAVVANKVRKQRANQGNKEHELALQEERLKKQLSKIPVGPNGVRQFPGQTRKKDDGLRPTANGNYEGSSGANVILYIGLGMVAMGLIITFVGLGEKGFRTLELKLIGPSLVGCGMFFALLRILFCTLPSCCRSCFKCCRKNEDAEKLLKKEEEDKEKEKDKERVGQPTSAVNLRKENRSLKENGRSSKENGRSLRGAGGSLRDNERSFRETGGSFRDNGKSLRENSSLRETGGSLRETGGSLRETGGSLRETGGSVRDNGSSLRNSGGTALNSFDKRNIEIRPKAHPPPNVFSDSDEDDIAATKAQIRQQRPQRSSYNKRPEKRREPDTFSTTSSSTFSLTEVDGGMLPRVPHLEGSKKNIRTGEIILNATKLHVETE